MPAILLWLIGPIGRYVLIAVAVSGALLWFKVHYENIGYQKALHAIAAQDQKAVEASNVAKKTVSECFASGGTWNVSDGVCDTANTSQH